MLTLFPKQWEHWGEPRHERDSIIIVRKKSSFMVRTTIQTILAQNLVNFGRKALPVPRAEIGGSLPGAIQEQELVFEEKRLSNDGTDTARSSRRARVARKWMKRTTRWRIEE